MSDRQRALPDLHLATRGVGGAFGEKSCSAMSVLAHHEPELTTTAKKNAGH